MPVRFTQAVEIGVERISQLARVCFAGDRACGAVELRSELRYEVIPGSRASVAARAGQREVRCAERFEIRFDGFFAWRRVCESRCDAARERNFESFASEIPIRRSTGSTPATIDGSFQG